MRNLLAFDLGASNGRAILGQFDGEKLTMRELHRFENNYIEMNGVFYWDLPYLYNQLKQGLLAFKNANVGELDCIGIDTWGVDYGLLDKNGQLLSNPRSYRYAVDEDMEAVWKTVDFPTLFARTGIATMNFNTVYQLYRRKRQHDPALDAAQTLLMLPDLLGFFLTGEAKTEYTNATTSMLYNPTTKDWDWQTIDALGLPRKIFTKLDRAGALRGTLRPELAEELGINQAHFAAVGTHDTASAVAAIPDEQLLEAWNAMLMPFDVQRVELLRELGKRCPVYLLSNTNLPHRIRFRESFRERFGGSFDELFVRCFYSDELHLRKPDPEIYRSVARQIGTPPGKLLFIDDNAANVSAARGEGWQACHLTGGITVTDLFEL